MQATRLSDQVARAVEARIADGTYPPGHRLTELGVAGELDVSQGTVRAAFRDLAARGLLDVRPYRGTTIREVGRREHEEARVMRAQIERVAAELAGPNIATLADDLRATAKRMTAAAIKGDADTAESANRDFQRLIVSAPGNTLLARLWEQLHEGKIGGASYAGLSRAKLKKLAAAHAPLVEAAADGHAARLANLLLDHPDAMRKLLRARQSSGGCS